jgi:hypothetical protein
MDLSKAELILSEAIDCYISQNPEKKGDITAAISTIETALTDAAGLIEKHGKLIERAGKILYLQDAVIRVASQVYS